MHVQRKALSISLYGRVLLVLTLLCALLQWSVHPVAASYQKNLVGPAGSGQFGYSVIALPSGNLVITDPYFDSGTTVDVGAVYLYDGFTRSLISTLTGSTANDQVGSHGVVVLTNGNFVVLSPFWNNGLATCTGAATWGSETTGVSGVVSAGNSLVGSTKDDQVGHKVTSLTNGNYVTYTDAWDATGPFTNVGAVTWVNGSTGLPTGTVSSSNSLVGSSPEDGVGSSAVKVLSNGNFVVLSPRWINGLATRAGAATWVNGSTGLPTGVVSSSNSLVGSITDDMVGYSVTPLTNGNYVTYTIFWNAPGPVKRVGAATWVNGSTGLPTGAVSSSNSLVGNTADDLIGSSAVKALSNGNYVVGSYMWDGPVVNGGVVTWGNGATGTTGPVTVLNSLYGSTANDSISINGIVALSNGNYVVGSSSWDNGGTADVGAATWVNGAYATGAQVTAANSLIGSTANAKVGGDITALSNGNYVVGSPYWENGVASDVGAATWGDGTIGTVGVVTSANSLVGSTTDDWVGYNVIPLNNGNYVVGSLYWDNEGTSDVGAATWGNGSTGLTTGVITTTNSLIGSTAEDYVGEYMTALTNGNYVVDNYHWDNGGKANVGAATWGNGSTGLTTGTVSTDNSLVGSTTNDEVGYDVTALANGDYVVFSQYWDYGASSDSGAVTWGRFPDSPVGPITAENSVLGLVMAQGASLNFTHNTVYGYLAVGRPAENLVTLFWLPRLYLPVSKK